MTAPTRVVHLYPMGQRVDVGIVEDGVPVTLGPGESNRTDTTEFYWPRDGSLNAVGDSARIVLYLPQLSSQSQRNNQSQVNNPSQRNNQSQVNNPSQLNDPSQRNNLPKPNSHPQRNNLPQKNSQPQPNNLPQPPTPETLPGAGQLIMICPGGGYNELMFRSEGTYAAQVLTARGYSVGIVCYRMPTGNGELPLRDVQNAFRYCRHHAREWGIRQIGIMGMSAGGHLAALASTLWTDAVTRPDFAILFYPVVSADPGLMHRGSFIRLTGLDKATLAAASEALAQEDREKAQAQKNREKAQAHENREQAPAQQGTEKTQAQQGAEDALPQQDKGTAAPADQASTDPTLAAAIEKVRRFAPDRNVTPETPPTLLLHSINDGVSPENSLRYLARLRENGVPAALHLFPEGGHGWGFNTLETTGLDPTQPAAYDRLGSSRAIFYSALFTFLDNLRDSASEKNPPPGE